MEALSPYALGDTLDSLPGDGFAVPAFFDVSLRFMDMAHFAVDMFSCCAGFFIIL
jgi:hypothetical protein